MGDDLDRYEALAVAASANCSIGLFRSDSREDQALQFAESLALSPEGPIYIVYSKGVVSDFDPAGVIPLYSAITGNGPTSEANAEFYSVARENSIVLIAEVRRLRALLAEQIEYSKALQNARRFGCRRCKSGGADEG